MAVMAALGALKGIGAIASLVGGAGGKKKESAGGGILGNLKGTGAAGAAAGGLLGAGQMIAGAIQRKKADSLLPPSENVMERQMLQTIRRRRRALETGTAGSADRAAIRQMGKSFGRNSFRAGGMGNFGQMAAIQSTAMQNLATTYGQQIGAQMQMEQAQTKSMADLANDLARLRSTRMSARAEANIQGGSQNLLSAIGPKVGAGEAVQNQYSSKASNLNTRQTDLNTKTNEQTEESAVEF